MSRVSDHDRRDAEHAARAVISLVLGRYGRRWYEEAKTHIATAITEAEPGELIDGTEIGRSAAESVIASYLGEARPEPALELAATEDNTTSDS